jgi:dTDP-D-glucose 4,6-dehydratase
MIKRCENNVEVVHFTEKLINNSIETNGIQLLRKTVFGENPNPSERNRGNP